MEFSFNTLYVLENEFVLLTPLLESHFNDLLPFSLKEPDLWKYSLNTCVGTENLKNYISKALLDREKETAYPFIVFDKIKKEYAGTTRLYDINLKQGYLSIGHTWYGEKFQGTMLNKACKYLLFEFVFETLKLQRVEFRADSRNLRSIAAIKSLGCFEEGILRSNGLALDGIRRDSTVLSLLQSEWANKVKSQLGNKLTAFS